ncbi:hypothetical protein CMQ_4225 [Grosmannia clavigera kw1407]|uniref:Uncharacterized protein n=1 Tax=Grosmannia clavigera (strain kw1407 / UAMH 11150) TaxID=655863 RepID=F0XAC1_GROCL|nr:uncharacterized protein CMQ_4225 [Grosmannia clavigera kw1407]EFX06156.1 hypothetical protein CMQ_4225 [Grosmannia clavigera kw1407]
MTLRQRLTSETRPYQPTASNAPRPTRTSTMQPDGPAEMLPLMVDDDDEELSDSELAGVRRPLQPPLPSQSPLPASRSWRQQNQWIVLALASGACAAFNGVFAKLTTTKLTGHLALGLAHALGLTKAAAAVEIVVRAVFFGLNLAFNGLMWTVFTKALARGHSATQVSVMNTSANFVLTALLGLMIFSEALPPLWWLGAAMLVAGNVIIGRKDEAGSDPASHTDEEELTVEPHTAVAFSDDLTAATSSGSNNTPRHRASASIHGSSVPREHDEDVLDLDVSHI